MMFSGPYGNQGRKPSTVVGSAASVAVWILFFLYAPPALLHADEIHLKDGRIIASEKAWVEGDQVKYLKFGAVVGYPRSQVKQIIQVDPEEGGDPARAPVFDVEPAPPARTVSAGEERSVFDGLRSIFRDEAAVPASRAAGSRGRSMSIQDFIGLLERIHPLALLGAFVFPPVAAWLLSLLHGRGNGGRNPWRYIHSLFVYLVCIPGMFSGVLIAYGLFFLRQNLLQVNVFVYFVPILSMILTLAVVGRNASWDRLPGVDRLYALMVVLVITFSVTLAIQKTRIWIFFGGSVKILIIIAVVCFILLRLSMRRLFRGKPDHGPR